MTDRNFNQPLSGNEMPRFAGHASMFRLPTQVDAQGLDIALVGVPHSSGNGLTERDQHLGPRAIRAPTHLRDLAPPAQKLPGAPLPCPARHSR